MIKISNLEVSLDKRKILTDVNLSVECGKIIGVVAPNGTGKTTFFKTIAGLLSPKKGKITLNQFDFYKDRSKYLSQLFFIESSSFLYSDVSVIDHLKYIKATWNSSIDVNQVIDELSMNEYKSLPIKKLSLGMKQHVLIGMYVISNAPLILLDEPMNGLDPTSLDMVSDLLIKMKNKGKIVMFSSHNLSNITDTCDEVMFMNNQNIEVVNNDFTNLKILYNELYIKKEKRNEPK